MKEEKGRNNTRVLLKKIEKETKEKETVYEISEKLAKFIELGVSVLKCLSKK